MPTLRGHGTSKFSFLKLGRLFERYFIQESNYKIFFYFVEFIIVVYIHVEKEIKSVTFFFGNWSCYSNGTLFND